MLGCEGLEKGAQHNPVTVGYGEMPGTHTRVPLQEARVTVEYKQGRGRARQKPFFREICDWIEISPGRFVRRTGNHTEIAMQTCLIPFSAFASVNWSDVRALEFETGPAFSGKVFFDSRAVVQG